MRYGSEGQEGEESRVLTVRGEKGTASIKVIIAGGCWGSCSYLFVMSCHWSQFSVFMGLIVWLKSM